MRDEETIQEGGDTAGFTETLESMKRDPRILAMREFPQHGSCNTYDHSVSVAEHAYLLAQLLHVQVDEQVLARGAMLHDFYLYNIQESGRSAWEHGTKHPEIALRNAEQFYELTERERDIIYSHMWPLTLTHIPHCRESVLISMADKYCALRERYLQGWYAMRYLKRRIVG
ncbi:MAG: HD domain-containing protein [Eubacteriales bacterium]|nr:HD domain-containing protein [Eubacteriales bacterium]